MWSSIQRTAGTNRPPSGSSSLRRSPLEAGLVTSQPNAVGEEAVGALRDAYGCLRVLVPGHHLAPAIHEDAVLVVAATPASGGLGARLVVAPGIEGALPDGGDLRGDG